MDKNFQNHLQFFRRHRGDFHTTANEAYIVSGIPGITSWTPFTADLPIPSSFDAVRLVPESGDAWPEKLTSAGFEPAEALTYMELGQRSEQTGKETTSIDIRRVSCADEAFRFATVQARGFMPEDAPPDDPWHTIFPRVAVRNAHDPDQDMLIARYDDEDAAVLLVVHTPGVAGIYAVTTAPEFRNLGLSGALLAAAIKIADRKNAHHIVLQAMQNSYAEGFYRRLGFEDQYTSRVWRRKSV